jgi:hypothetical protein
MAVVDEVIGEWGGWIFVEVVGRGHLLGLGHEERADEVAGRVIDCRGVCR